VVIGTDCTGSCESNYYMNTTTTYPSINPVSESVCWYWKDVHLSRSKGKSPRQGTVEAMPL
jgi:hypothetical protein